MKWTLCAALCATLFSSPLLANPTQPKSPPPFDADLFRKEAQVVSGHVEFLYWTVEEGALDYALTMQHPNWGSSTSYAQGELQEGSFNWDPGVRLSLSYFRAPKEWEVKGSYTRLTSRGYDSVSKPGASGEYLTGTWPQITTAPLSSATSQLHLNYNVFDLTIDRYFIPNPHLRLRLLGGFTVAWMEQDWRVIYSDAVQRSTNIHNQWKFVGGGLKMGLMFDWYWTTDVYMTGYGFTGILMGNYQNLSHQTVNFQPTGDDNPEIPLRDLTLNTTRPAYTAQFGFGPSWQKSYTQCRVEVFAGYEFNVWMNLQEVYHSTGGSATATKETWINSSMMALQGLTTRLTVDF